MSAKGYKTECVQSKQKLEKLMATQQTCDWIPLTGNTLGEGVDAYTVQVCCNGNCLFVAKIIEGKSKEKVVHEMAMQSAFAAIGKGIAPALVDAWSCGGTSYLIMEKIDTSVEQYIHDLANTPQVELREIASILQFIKDKVVAMVAAAHRHKLVHNDLNLGNVMLNLDENERPASVKLIDFSEAKKVSSAEEADRLEKTREIEMSIEMLLNTAKDLRSYLLQSGTAYKAPPSASLEAAKSKRKMRMQMSATPVKVAQPMFDDVDDAPQPVEFEPIPIDFGFASTTQQGEPILLRPGPNFNQYQPVIAPMDMPEIPTYASRAPPAAPKKGRRLF